MFLIEDETIGLIRYSHEDDCDMFACWNDIDTQKAYNGIFHQTLEEFSNFDIDRYLFWVTVVDKMKNNRIGTLRLGLDEECPDLAVWIYPTYRNNGYGTRSFQLALLYIFEHFPYCQISAGCYSDNIYSQKMLKKIGFLRYPAGDAWETNCFTGQPIQQMEFRISRDKIR